MKITISGVAGEGKSTVAMELALFLEKKFSMDCEILDEDGDTVTLPERQKARIESLVNKKISCTIDMKQLRKI